MIYFGEPRKDKGAGKVRHVEKVGKIEGRERTHRGKASILTGQMAEEDTNSKATPMDKPPVI